MKKFLLLSMLCFFASISMKGQCNKYDGDWNATFRGLGVKTMEWGTGKRIYRIKTIEGKTTVRAKVQYPSEDEYTYYEFIVTSCTEASLDCYSVTSSHYDDKSGEDVQVKWFCRLSYNSGTLLADCYHEQYFLKNGDVLRSVKYYEEKFTLYKDGDDW
ncbi:MAG: hypothetical protein IJT04_03950 [Bacteroidales bacterium]|nr:hypothetical protein [Bacteroidales bacterium]